MSEFHIKTKLCTEVNCLRRAMLGWVSWSGGGVVLYKSLMDYDTK